MPGVQLRPTLPAGSIPTSVVTGDFNQDGHMDFIVANALDNDLWIYLGKGDGTFQLPRVIPLSKGLAPVGLAVGDLRGIGKLDLVLAEADTETVTDRSAGSVSVLPFLRRDSDPIGKLREGSFRLDSHTGGEPAPRFRARALRCSTRRR